MVSGNLSFLHQSLNKLGEVLPHCNNLMLEMTVPEFSSATGSCEVQIAQCIYGTTAMAMQELLVLTARLHEFSFVESAWRRRSREITHE